MLLGILGEKIRDNRFLRLIRSMLRAGYLEDWTWNATLSGAPQGGVASPVLSNIYLDRLDKFAETVLIPEYTRGKSRKANPAWTKVANAMAAARRRGDHAAVRELRQQRRGLPARDPGDPGYRRLRYLRYADDHLFGFTGPKAEAEQIKARLARFLHDDLKLELSPDKTLITHGRTQAARFLGYDITVQHSPSRPSVNGVIGLRVPRTVITAKQAPYFTHGKPGHRPELMNLEDPEVISVYGAEYRGLIQYYLLAGNVSRLHQLRWAAETSLLKTLAAKHRSTVTKMARKSGSPVHCCTGAPSGPRVHVAHAAKQAAWAVQAVCCVTVFPAAGAFPPVAGGVHEVCSLAACGSGRVVVDQVVRVIAFLVTCKKQCSQPWGDWGGW